MYVLDKCSLDANGAMGTVEFKYPNANHKRAYFSLDSNPLCFVTSSTKSLVHTPVTSFSVSATGDAQEKTYTITINGKPTLQTNTLIGNEIEKFKAFLNQVKPHVAQQINAHTPEPAYSLRL